MTPAARWEQRLAELREAFDRSFTEPAAALEAPAASERVLLATVAGVQYAVRLADCAGAARAQAIHLLQSRQPAFEGLALVRGSLLPVYCLARLLGIDAASDPRGWLLVTAGADPIALAVDAVDGPVPALPRGPASETVLVGGSDCRLLQMDRLLGDLYKLLDERSARGEAR